MLGGRDKKIDNDGCLRIAPFVTVVTVIKQY